MAIQSEHYTDTETGLPDGGFTSGVGFTIQWQKGKLVTDGERSVPNGAFVMAVIEAAKDRIEYYQRTQFACQENTTAIANLADALRVLQARQDRRTEAGTAGTHRGA